MRRVLAARAGSLSVLFGRQRCGKSRLLLETLPRRSISSTDRTPIEIDAVAESEDGHALLLGEVTWSEGASRDSVVERLRGKARRFPLATGREVLLAVWMRKRRGRSAAVAEPDARDVLRALR